MSANEPLWRIGELSRRVGVSAATLRAWEHRYGLLKPTRTAGNYRLYGPADEQRVRRVLADMEAGLSTAEAARRALGEEEPPGLARDRLDDLAGELLAALEALDDLAAKRAMDRLFSRVTIEVALRDAILPVLREIGERWARNQIGVAEEHYASNLIQTRLQAIAGSWPATDGPRGVLACVPGELHSIGLLCHALALRSRGWNVWYLGQDTPVPAIERAAERVRPRLVVLSATLPERFVSVVEAGLRLPHGAKLAIGGRGASPAAAERLGALMLEGDPLDAAEALAALPA